MPPLRLTSLLHTALPHLSTQSRAILSALACRNGVDLTPAEAAAWVGLRDRYQLGRVLRRDGLPPFETLLGWARLIHWLTEAETSGASLQHLAQQDRFHPAAAYRLVRRLTGQCWSELRRAGVTEALSRLQNGRRAHQDRGTSRTTGRASSDWQPRTAALHHPELAHPSGALFERVVVDNSPFDVAVTPQETVLATCAHAAVLDVVSLQPFARVGLIPTGSVPTRVRVSRTGDFAYVTNQFAEAIGIVDVRAARQVGSVAVRGHPLGAALTPDGRILFVTTNTDQLHALNLGTKKVVSSAPIPMGSPQITMHPAGHRVYVSGYRTGVVAECDTSTLRTVRTFRLGGVVQDVAVSADGARLYAANESGWLDAVALRAGRHEARLELGTGALGLALNPRGTTLLVSLVFAGRVAVIDPASFSVRAILSPGGKPRLMAFAPDGVSALIANEAGWIDRIR